MNYSEFVGTLNQAQPPETSSPLLEALWHDAKGDWHQAHNIAQDIPSADGSWMHAYLHRKEGDLSNAGYWYSKAGKPVATRSLEEEWEQLVKEFLAAE